MVQNSTGVYVLAIDSNSKTINASDIQMGSSALANFKNCKVWIESTNDRITTAKMATQETADVTITQASNMIKTSESGAENQTGITEAMKDVVYKANSGYYFPDNYVSTISGLTDSAINGIKVTRDSATQITVSGAPTAKSTTITLSEPTEKVAASTPDIKIDYVKETLTGFDTATEYSINGKDAFTLTSSTIPIDNSYYGTTIKIKKTKTDTALESAEQSLDIPTRPTAPNVIGTDETVDGKNDGTITGVNDTMEYSMSKNGSWKECSIDAVDGTISKLGDGTYYVRTKATTSSFVGEITTITIEKGVPVKKVLSVTVPTFDTVTEGYTRPETKTITIKNDTADGSNWEATVSGVTLTGTDADKFEVTGSGYDWTIQPKSDLTANTDGTAKTYTAIINVAYDATEGVTSPATAEVSFTVRKPRLNSITAPSSITGVANGTDRTAAALGLPSTVTISTEDSTVITANVNWDLTKLADGSYDKTVLTEQTFTVNGTVELPDAIDANGKSLNVTIKVTVDAAPYVEKVSANPVAGSYTENQNVTLSTSTEGAEIYYTTDGSTPDKTNGTKYTGAISVTGTAGQSVSTTIKAIAIKSGMQNSDVVSATYVIEIPAPAPTPTYTITAGAGGTHELSTDGTLTITCDGALDKLTGIYVDDKFVDAANYTLKSGSTIITFKADYLNTLSVGTHKVKFQYSDGSTETTFVIKAASVKDTTQDTTAPSEKDDAPKAGDSTPIAWLFIIAVISGAGVVYFGRKKKTVR